MRTKDDIFCTFVSVGLAADGEQREIYRAQKGLICAKCKLSIKLGELFVRKEIGGGLPLVSCLCSSCAPFRLAVNDRPTPGDEGSSPMAEHSDDTTSLHRAVEERLGPALRRSRRIQVFKRGANRFTSN